jgi:hypothetical protein
MRTGVRWFLSLSACYRKAVLIADEVTEEQLLDLLSE